MQIATFPDDPPPRWPNPVLALGNFDGLHRGHMKIIDRVRQRAGERGGTPAAMTFDPHPPRVLRPDKAPALLMTRDQKIEALRRSGMQGLAFVRFTRELSLWDPETFVRTVLVEWLHVVGGLGRRQLPVRPRARRHVLGAAHARRRATASAPRRSIRSATRTSSSAAPACAGSSPRGASTKPAALLGHHYFLDGTVVRGAGRGRSIGVPTANLATPNDLVPPAGVYATLATVDGDRPARRSPTSACARRSVTSTRR